MKYRNSKYLILATIAMVLSQVSVSAASAAVPDSPDSKVLAVSTTAQDGVVCKGVVVDNNGEPLVGATVRIVGTSLGTATDIDGNFTLSNVPVGASIEISYIGYTPQIIKFDGKSPLSIKLMEESTTFDEVVVIGYGVTQKRAKVTNSISRVDEKTLTVGANANPAQALAGAVPGVKVYVQSGSPAETPSITI